MGSRTHLLLFAVLGALPGATAAAEPADPFSGRFGHAASEPAYAPVWEVRRVGSAWQAGNIVEGENRDAHRLSAAGREAFWQTMDWPAETSRGADCLSWGERPSNLMDLLADTPPVAVPGAPGYAVLCHVPSSARKAIDWLSDEPHDWFYYDPVVGVMGVRQLR